MVVDIKKVIPHTDNASKREIWHMMDVLNKQGQIEPLQVKVYAPAMPGYEESYITHERDAWGNVIVLAAQRLNWPTLLILVTERYID